MSYRHAPELRPAAHAHSTDPYELAPPAASHTPSSSATQSESLQSADRRNTARDLQTPAAWPLPSHAQPALTETRIRADRNSPEYSASAASPAPAYSPAWHTHLRRDTASPAAAPIPHDAHA